VRTARRPALALAGLLVLLVPTAAAMAETPPNDDDPELAALLLTVDDLPPGWQPFETPFGVDPVDPNADPNDPCVRFWHTFDAGSVSPHATAAFMSGQYRIISETVFRLENPAAASELVQTFIADLAACPGVTGIDGNVTTFVPLSIPDFGDVSAAYRGEMSVMAMTFVTLISAAAIDDLVITVSISDPTADEQLFERLVVLASDRVAAGAVDAASPGGATTGDDAGGKPDLTVPPT
jgi:hypothetical protein